MSGILGIVAVVIGVVTTYLLTRDDSIPAEAKTSGELPVVSSHGTITKFGVIDGNVVTVGGTADDETDGVLVLVETDPVSDKSWHQKTPVDEIGGWSANVVISPPPMPADYSVEVWFQPSDQPIQKMSIAGLQGGPDIEVNDEVSLLLCVELIGADCLTRQYGDPLILKP